MSDDITTTAPNDDTAYVAPSRQAVHARIRNHTVFASAAYKALLPHAEEMIHAASIDGPVATVVFIQRYGRREQQGQRVITLLDSGEAYEIIHQQFVADSPDVSLVPPFNPRTTKPPSTSGVAGPAVRPISPCIENLGHKPGVFTPKVRRLVTYAVIDRVTGRTICTTELMSFATTTATQMGFACEMIEGLKHTEIIKQPLIDMHTYVICDTCGQVQP